jgi:hypothetical protein
MNNKRNKEENSKNENNSSVNIQKMKKSLDNKSNLSNDNHLKIKNQEKPYISIHNQRGRERNMQSSSELNSKNYNSNKFLINEELDNNNAKNIQTKTTRVLRIKNTENNNRPDGSNRRLNLKSVEPQKRNQNTIFYSSNITHTNDKKKDVRQNSLNNHKFYDSNNSRRNKKETNSNITKPPISNNINTINIQNTQKRNHTITVIKDNATKKENKNDKDKDKEKQRDINKIDYRIKKPNIQIKSTYNSNSLTSIEDKKNEEEDKEDIPHSTTPKMMFSEDNDFGEMKTPIKLSPEIFGLYHPKFKQSMHSLENEFKNSEELIKAYAYNSSEGNIREYNEDTITVTKVNLNPKEKNNYCYFFAVYDGHGGNGCSYYLKNNLHKNISEFSVDGVKKAIELTENNFLTKKAVDFHNNILDTSGSCASILLIKNKKCIIANIGDSRLIIFKNKRVIF